MKTNKEVLDIIFKTLKGNKISSTYVSINLKSLGEFVEKKEVKLEDLSNDIKKGTIMDSLKERTYRFELGFYNNKAIIAYLGLINKLKDKGCGGLKGDILIPTNKNHTFSASPNYPKERYIGSVKTELGIIMNQKTADQFKNLKYVVLTKKTAKAVEVCNGYKL